MKNKGKSSKPWERSFSAIKHACDYHSPKNGISSGVDKAKKERIHSTDKTEKLADKTAEEMRLAKSRYVNTPKTDTKSRTPF